MADSSKKKKLHTDEQQRELEEALDRPRVDLPGDMEENRNLSGSSTWETLSEKYNDENLQHGRRTQAASPREEPREGERGRNADEAGAAERSAGSPEAPRTERERAREASRPGATNPPRTTEGPITAPKFGSAGSGGAELEPGPERD